MTVDRVRVEKKLKLVSGCISQYIKAWAIVTFFK